jgi:hypothetical protein
MLNLKKTVTMTDIHTTMANPTASRAGHICADFSNCFPLLTPHTVQVNDHDTTESVAERLAALEYVTNSQVSFTSKCNQKYDNISEMYKFVHKKFFIYLISVILVKKNNLTK